MSRLSGWCSQLGRPNHTGCRYADCTCNCHTDPKNSEAPT